MNEETLHTELTTPDDSATNPALKEQLDGTCDPVALDATRAQRLNMLAKADNILAKADAGKKIDRRDMLFVLRELRNLCSSHEGLSQQMIEDLVQIVRRLEMMNVSIIQLNVGLTAQKQVCEEKGLYTEEDLKAAWTGIVKTVLAQQKEQQGNEEESAPRIVRP